MTINNSLLTYDRIMMMKDSNGLVWYYLHR